MTFELGVGIILWIIVLVLMICAGLHQRQKAKERIRRYTANIITSQTRPLIIYHVPVSSIQETTPSAYDQVVGN
jgi:hypothetical protein